MRATQSQAARSKGGLHLELEARTHVRDHHEPGDADHGHGAVPHRPGRVHAPGVQRCAAAIKAWRPSIAFAAPQLTNAKRHTQMCRPGREDHAPRPDRTAPLRSWIQTSAITTCAYTAALAAQTDVGVQIFDVLGDRTQRRSNDGAPKFGAW